MKDNGIIAVAFDFGTVYALEGSEVSGDKSLSHQILLKLQLGISDSPARGSIGGEASHVADGDVGFFHDVNSFLLRFDYLFFMILLYTINTHLSNIIFQK